MKRCSTVWKLRSISLPNANDLVPRHGKKRIYHPLDECGTAMEEKIAFVKEKLEGI